MNFLGSFGTMDDAYAKITQSIRVLGEPFLPQSTAGSAGGVCCEIRPASFMIQDPTRSLYTGAERRLNYRFWVVEALGYLAGDDSESYAQLICRANSQYSKYVAPSGRLAGAYGPRLKQGLLRAFDRLKSDKDTRQAVCSIWSPGEDLDQQNLMCTLSLQFLTNHGKLDLLAVMRSNDSNWGLPYDVPAFCLLQIAMASALDLDVGSYHHVAGSLHTYLGTPPVVDEEPKNPKHYGIDKFGVGRDLSGLMNLASKYLDELKACDNLNSFETTVNELEFLDARIRQGRSTC